MYNFLKITINKKWHEFKVVNHLLHDYNFMKYTHFSTSYLLFLSPQYLLRYVHFQEQVLLLVEGHSAPSTNYPPC